MTAYDQLDGDGRTQAEVAEMWANRGSVKRIVGLTPREALYLLTLMGYAGPSTIRPDPTFTGQDALALAEKLKAELEKAG